MVAALIVLAWIGWAVWANMPHYYDTQALQAELAVSMPQATPLPASAGFPFSYMHYQYSPDGTLQILDSEPSAVLPNLLFCVTGILGVSLLLFRIRNVSVAGACLFFLLAIPALVSYVLLNGPHPDVIRYVYLGPLAILLTVLCHEAWKSGNGRTELSGEVPVVSPTC
ncbi:MAG: hypothetical protein Aurels2KO_33000 [Aureliella sp.]